MPLRLRFFKLDRHDVNFTSGFLNLLAVSMVLTALTSNEWLILDNAGTNTTIGPDGRKFDVTLPAVRAQLCDRVGARDFWRQMRIGSFPDESGKTHMIFHAKGRLLVDCINPLMTTLFYAMIAIGLCMMVVGSSAAFLHLAAPQHGFVAWLRRNTILEMIIMMLTLAVCVSALFAQNELQMMRPYDEISIGPGIFLLSGAGLISFIGAAFSIKHWARQQRGRRMDNQRLTRPRALPQWRGADRRPEDIIPIIDFESYLDTPKLTGESTEDLESTSGTSTAKY